MELQSATIRNIQFAWSRILDIDEEEMADASTRTYRESRDSPLLMFVSLFGKGVLVGPAWAMAAARTLTDAQLARHSVLLELSRRPWEKPPSSFAIPCPRPPILRCR
ncbi:hypothetical protein [Arthrobacter sp. ZGTC212]|uniref:hypothetical protein n=1 Tax=Arthrobacter sp. ZGTC212 TaxID=2058899 RepID=UPI000CE543EB|nr:hypothetical protein [Arthrobacter sp. ZGTC212]